MMVKLLNYFLRSLLICGIGFLGACEQSLPLYKKEFSAEEKKAMANQLLNGLSSYYQGSVPEQFLLEESVKLNPINADIHRELGVAYLKRGLPHEFEKHYGDAIKYSAVDWQGWRGYIYLYFYRDYERALADFQALDVLTPNFVDYPQSTSILYMSAVCYMKMEQYEDALTYFDKHITEELRISTEDFIDSKTFLFQGICHYKNGDKKAAEASWDRGLKNASDNADLWYWKAIINNENGKQAEALVAIDKAQDQFDKEYYNHRPYVEEFFQIHQTDIEEWKAEILLDRERIKG